MGIIFCIVLLTVGLGFEDLTYRLWMIISECVDTRTVSISMKIYHQYKTAETLTEGASG